MIAIYVPAKKHFICDAIIKCFYQEFLIEMKTKRKSFHSSNNNPRIARAPINVKAYYY